MHSKLMRNNTVLYLKLCLATQVLSQASHQNDLVDFSCLSHEWILKLSSSNNMHLKISITTGKQYSSWKRQVFETFFHEKVKTCLNVSPNLIISEDKIYSHFMNKKTVQIYELYIHHYIFIICLYQVSTDIYLFCSDITLLQVNWKDT